VARTVIAYTVEGVAKQEAFNEERNAHERMCELYGKGIKDAKIVGNAYYGER
jgi:hypothetical protein